LADWLLSVGAAPGGGVGTMVSLAGGTGSHGLMRPEASALDTLVKRVVSLNVAKVPVASSSD